MRRKKPLLIISSILTLLFLLIPLPTVQADYNDTIVPDGYRPWNLAVDSNNDIWFGANKWEGTPAIWKGYIMRYNTTGQTFDAFPIPTSNPGPILSVTIDSNDDKWVCERDSHKIAKISGETVTEYAVGSSEDPAYPVTVEANGTDIWIGCAKTVNNKIMKFISSTQTLINYSLPQQYSSSEIRDIKIRNGTIWFTDARSNYIGELNPVTNNFTFHGPLTSHALFLDIDSQGKVWFTENWANRLGVYNPTNFSITEYFLNSTQGEDTPYGLVIDNNDDVWFSENLLKKIGKFDHILQTITEYDVSSKPYDVVKDKNGNIWFIGAGSWHIGRLDPTLYIGMQIEKGLQAIVSSKSTVTVDEEFTIRGIIKNVASQPITNLKVELSLTKNLLILAKNESLRVNIGTLKVDQCKILEWHVKATAAGKYVNKIFATGMLMNGDSAYARVIWEINVAN